MPHDVVISYAHCNLWNTRLLTELLPTAEARGTGVMNASPLAMGLLTNQGAQPWFPGQPEVVAACKKAAELCRKTASIDATLLDGDELTGSLLELEDARRLIDAAVGHLLAELEHRDQCVDEHGLQTASWFARETRTPIGPARRRVRVAVLLRHQLPVVDEALADARISFAHAEVLAWAQRHFEVRQ